MLSRHHQIALLDPSLSSVLVAPTEHGLRLPGPDSRWPDHRDLVARVRAPGALAVAPPWREDDGTVTNVLVGRESRLEDAEWVALAELEGVSEATASRLRRTAEELRAGIPDDGRAAWWHPGWWDRVDAWVAEVMTLHGWAPAGPREPVKVWSLSAVGRYPAVRDGVTLDLWFKATCEGFRTEPALTQAVQQLAPHLVPVVLGVEADEAWMLMEPFEEAEREVNLAHAPQMAGALADLQLATLPEREALARAGLPDRGLEATLAGLRTVLHDSVERPLMSEELQAELPALEAWLEERVRAFWSHGVPDTLSHGDLHTGNATWVGDHPVFFDWTDACLSHPFLDVRHLAEDAAGSLTTDDRAERDRAYDAVWAAYSEPWRASLPGLDLEAAWADVEVAERVFQMISYEGIYRAQPEESRWELSTVVVEFLEKLVALQQAQRG